MARENQGDDSPQEFGMRMQRGKHGIQQRFAGVGQHQSGHAVDGHQNHSTQDQPFARLDQCPHLRPQLFEVRQALARLSRRPTPSARVRRALRPRSHPHSVAPNSTHALNPLVDWILINTGRFHVKQCVKAGQGNSAENLGLR